ncbi:MAG: hypothetical protein KGL95_05555, partial [Patescibacteria group bacterium]|nr:hypothetical protein [Patescibacteria group bacterium]
ITDWKDSVNPIKYTLLEFTTKKGKKIKKYFIKVGDMKQIDVDKLQKKIEEAWKEFEIKT